MTRTKLAGAAVAALSLAVLGACNNPAAGPSPAADTSKIADAIKADQAQLVADFNNHDADKAASHDAADIVAMGHGFPNVTGQAADLAASKKGFADDPTQHVTTDAGSVDVAASGDMAVYRSTYTFTGVNPKTKQAMKESGNYLAGYKKQPDGSWKIAWSVVSDTPPPAPATNAPG